MFYVNLQAVEAFILEHERPPVVLDIGCGTGLLSMLAVRAGAAEVIGCELYEPLAQVAREVTELNCEGKIEVGFPRYICSLREIRAKIFGYICCCDVALLLSPHRCSFDPPRTIIEGEQLEDLSMEVPRRYSIVSGPPRIRRSA